MDFQGMQQSEFNTFVDTLSDDQLFDIAQAMTPGWSGGVHVDGEPITDEDGFATRDWDKLESLPEVHKECWRKYNRNPHINSHVVDVQGALTGYGFGVSCDVQAVQDAITEIEDDIRNELPMKYPKFVGRTEIEGELFLALTVHTDGFIEIDFIDPSTLVDGDDQSGIYFHPVKQTMPLYYKFKKKGKLGVGSTMIIPSIYLAHLPKLAEDFKKDKGFTDLLKDSKASGNKYKKLGGFKRFIIQWDRALFQARNVSHIRTTLEWINHYENLKKWEIDHKKSAGAYLWVFGMTDARAFRNWLKMTDEDKKKCGITAKKVPGSSIILPPGVTLECRNPSLPNISEQDTDIMHMITSGLNKPEDMVTGQTKGDTFSGVKASRAPQSDRIGNMVCNFERFLRYNFWRHIFFLKSSVTAFKLKYKVKEAVAFEEGKPKFKKVEKLAFKLLEFEFPISEVSDMAQRAQALLGSKHPNVVEFLGIDRKTVAKKLGFNAYRSHRLAHATEEEEYPELPNAAIVEAGAEDAQEVSPDKAKPANDKAKPAKPAEKKSSRLKKPVKK